MPLLPVVHRFRLFFALSYSAIGIFMPYLALFLTYRNLTGWQIGLLLATIPLVSFLTQPLWGAVSDVYHVRKQGLVVACFGAAALALLYGLVTDFRLLLLVTVGYALMQGAINPLGTALTLDYLEDRGGQVEFGSLRLWGSIGFALCSFAIGTWVIETNPGGIIPLYSFTMLLLGINVMILPDAPAHGRADWREGVALLRQEQGLLPFLVGILLIGATLGIVNNYLALYLTDIHAAGWIIGGAMAISALAEVPLMANAPAFLRRWGVRLVFVGGVAVLPLRWLLYLFIEEPLLVLPTQVLHSIAMLSLLVVGVLYMDQHLSRRWRASGQALYNAALHGLGPSIGLFAAGQLYEGMGIHPVWMLSLVLSLVGTFILNLAVRSQVASRPQPEAIP